MWTMRCVGCAIWSICGKPVAGRLGSPNVPHVDHALRWVRQMVHMWRTPELALSRGSGLDREAGLDPVLNALGVLADMLVAHGLELRGHLPAVRARRVRAVRHDRRVLVRQQRRGLGL